ncbi:MAG: hypothetical protein FJX34_00145 [Alphaproteobacteria bacterium]|nr:hypothetical protein [Alphaproteobacteria bacterium]
MSLVSRFRTSFIPAKKTIAQQIKITVKRFLLIFIFLNFVSLELFAAAKHKGSPTRIRSDVIDIKRKSEVIEFLNNVVVEKDNSSLLAQKMTVLYDEKSSEKSEIRRIEAKENVKIFSEEFVASGDFGYYEPKQEIFVLEKNVIVNNGTSIASGDKFIYNTTSKKGRFVGKKEETAIATDKRVVVVIGSDLKKEKNERKDSKSEEFE